MFTKRDQGLLISLYRSEGWGAIERVIGDLSLSWQTDTQTANTEWTYLRDSLLRDGRIEGMRLLMKEIERIAIKDV